MNEEIKNLPQEQVEKFLPEALRRAITAYDERAGQDSGQMKSKDFIDHQKACKAAAAHIELLVKLARMIGMPEAATGEGDRAVMEALLRVAEDDLSDYEGKNEGMDEA